MPTATTTSYNKKEEGKERAGNCLSIYLAPLSKYGTSNIMGLWSWPFGVTWRHWSRDHSTHGGYFHCDHATIWHRHRDMAPQSTCTQTHTHTHDQSLNLLQCSL